jgi:hypothetical protein
MSDFQSAFDAKFTLFDVKGKEVGACSRQTGSIEIETGPSHEAGRMADFSTG